MGVAAKSRPQYDPKDVINVEDEYLSEDYRRFDPMSQKSSSSWYRQPESSKMQNDNRQVGDFRYKEHGYPVGYRIEEEDGISGYRIEEEKDLGGYRIEERGSNNVYQIEQGEIRSSWRIPPGGRTYETREQESRKFLDVNEIKNKKKRGKKMREFEDSQSEEIVKHSVDHVEEGDAKQKKDDHSSSHTGSTNMKIASKRGWKMKRKEEI